MLSSLERVQDNRAGSRFRSLIEETRRDFGARRVGSEHLPGASKMLFTRSTMRRFLFMVWGFMWVFDLGSACHSQGVPAAYGFHLNGEPVRSLAPSAAAVVVLFFAASDCPISNRYVPEIRRIEEKFAAQNVVLWFVYPNFGETPEGVKRHEAAYGAEEHILLDPNHQLVALAHTRVTPEAAVLVPDHPGGESLRPVFHGRIDDRYLSLGQERPKATQHDLERAIADVLQHRAVEPPNGPARGCGIIGRP
jgi:hypothetical protein